MNIVVNGKKQTIEETEFTVAQLLELNKVEQPEMVSVQLNEEFVDSDDYAETVIKENDEIDFLYFMGGGSNCK